MQPDIAIITPCYNEGETVIRFLENLEEVICSLPHMFTVIVVNDCSDDDTQSLLAQFKFRHAGIKLEIVNLAANSGHQAAIYRGLQYAGSLPCGQFIVMDADGEDSPAVIPQLLMHPGADIVHVIRNNRKESWVFRFFYRSYRTIFRLITGKRMNYGNYCLISRKILAQAVASSFLHFAAFLSRMEGNVEYIAADREKRIGGRSKMSYLKLMGHAARSFAEYRDEKPVLRLLPVKRSPRNRA